jgi:hypothetical protein
VVTINDKANASASDASQAERQLAREKNELKQLENARHKHEAKDEKRQRQAERYDAAMRKKCASLAQRKKWSEEDAAKGGTINSIEKAKTKARRIAEQYELECGK